MPGSIFLFSSALLFRNFSAACRGFGPGILNLEFWMRPSGRAVFPVGASLLLRSRSHPCAEGHSQTMKVPEPTPHRNSPPPLPSPLGRGKRGRGEGYFKGSRQVQESKSRGAGHQAPPTSLGPQSGRRRTVPCRPNCKIDGTKPECLWRQRIGSEINHP